MDIAVKKVELIEWLTRIQDHALLEKVENLKQQAMRESYEVSLKPMSSEQYKEVLDNAEENYRQGKLTSQQDIEEESKNCLQSVPRG